MCNQRQSGISCMFVSFCESTSSVHNTSCILIFINDLILFACSIVAGLLVPVGSPLAIFAIFAIGII